MPSESKNNLPEWLPRLSYEVLASAAADFDLDEAGAYVLGCEIADILSPDVHEQILLLIGRMNETDSRFAAGMQEHLRIPFGRALRVSNQLICGLRGKPGEGE